MSSVGRKNTNKGDRWKLPVLMAVVFLTGVASCAFAFKGAVDKVVDEARYPVGTVVNNIDIGGMQREEAEELVYATERRLLNSIDVTLNCHGESFKLDAETLGITGDAKSVLERAKLDIERRDGSITNDVAIALSPEKGESYQTTLIVSAEALREKVTELLCNMREEPINATAAFNKETTEFTFTKEKQGYRADIEAAYEAVVAAVAGGASTVEVPEIVVEPAVTEAELRENSVLIATYSTVASKNAARDTNIRLMCEAVDGQCIKPGETLSINGLVGERTAAKGFQKAPAIMDGKTIEDDMGGGICQLAGTLYNAALLADMEIVERVHHSFPSAYLPIGLDATLNWDNKDLKIRNRSEYPIYISASFIDQVVTVQIFGKPPADGMEIVVSAEMLREIKPGSAEIIFTDALAPGQTQTKVQARTGYEVMTYREYYLNGELVDKQLLYYDKYRAINAVIYRGSDTEPK